MNQRLSTAVFWTFIALSIFVGLDIAVFRSGWYLPYLEPSSAAAPVELRLNWLHREPPGDVPEVVVIGDSRVAEGFSARQANAKTQNHVKFWNLGIPGTSPRDWYYVIRDADPARRRFAAVVIALAPYSDEDLFEILADRLADVSTVIGRLRFSDCWGFAMSMKQWENRTQALSGCLFKGMTLRRDVREFYRDRKGRLERAGDWWVHGHGYMDGYGGKPETLAGLSIDWASQKIQLPNSIENWQKESIESAVMGGVAPQTGEMTRYRQRWLGDLVKLYDQSRTRLIFVQMPRSPFPDPVEHAPARFIHTLTGRPRIVTVPPGAFHDLERPDIFADWLHLNSEGRVLFSDKLADTISAVLAGS